MDPSRLCRGCVNDIQRSYSTTTTTTTTTTTATTATTALNQSINQSINTPRPRRSPIPTLRTLPTYPPIPHISPPIHPPISHISHPKQVGGKAANHKPQTTNQTSQSPSHPAMSHRKPTEPALSTTSCSTSSGRHRARTNSHLILSQSRPVSSAVSCPLEPPATRSGTSSGAPPSPDQTRMRQKTRQADRPRRCG